MNEQASLPALKRKSRLRLIEVLTTLFIVTMALVTMARYLVGAPLPHIVLATEVGYGLVLLGCQRFARYSQSLLLPGWLLLGGLLLTILVIAQAGGGLNAPILVTLPLIPMLAALLLGRDSLPPFVAMIALLLLGLYGLQWFGMVEMQPLGESMVRVLRVVVVVVLVLFCAGLGYYCDRQNDKMHHQLTLWANTDGLTGVANRRFFDQCLQQEWLRNQRVNRPLSLLLIDIDHFKHYNDAYGHVEGDRCLMAIAQTIASHCRRSGELVARYGGEEFAVILPNVEWTEAEAIANSLRLDIEALYGKAHPDLKQTVTVSIGFASAVPRHGEQQESFVVQADNALYRAKLAGRNQSVGANTLEDPVNV